MPQREGEERGGSWRGERRRWVRCCQTRPQNRRQTDTQTTHKHNTHTNTTRKLHTNYTQATHKLHTTPQAEISAIRDDVAPAWLKEPLSLEETAARYVRPSLQSAFLGLCTRPVRDYLDRFGFRSDLVKVMYAVTDGFSGLNGGWDTPGTGLNFLAHNMCRLPGAGGTWMVVAGGMGAVTRQLAAAALAAGARIETNARVAAVDVANGGGGAGGGAAAAGVVLEDGRRIAARVVVGGCGVLWFFAALALCALGGLIQHKSHPIHNECKTFKTLTQTHTTHTQTYTQQRKHKTPSACATSPAPPPSRAPSTPAWTRCAATARR